MTINLSAPELTELKPRIVVIGVGGAGGNAVNNMIDSGLQGVDFIIANTDSQSLALSKADRKVQLGTTITQGLGCGARPEVGREAAREAIDEVLDHFSGAHMAFVTAGMGGGTGTGAAPVIAEALREQGILTVGVVTKPFQFEGSRRSKLAEAGIEELQHFVDTLIVIPNQNLFRLANEKTTFAEAFSMADNVLHAGVRGITDLMVMPGLINLDFADVRTVMSEMGKAMMGTGEAAGEQRAIDAAESAISNPLLDEVSMKGARGLLINISGGMDLTLYEVDEAANRIREEVDADANIIVGSALDDTLNGMMRVSVVATGIDAEGVAARPMPLPKLATNGGRAVRAKADMAAPQRGRTQQPMAQEQTSVREPVMTATDRATEPRTETTRGSLEPEDVELPLGLQEDDDRSEPMSSEILTDAPRISEIMSRLRQARGSVPAPKPIEPEPDHLTRKEALDRDPVPGGEPFIAPAAAHPDEIHDTVEEFSDAAGAAENLKEPEDQVTPAELMQEETTPDEPAQTPKRRGIFGFSLRGNNKPAAERKAPVVSDAATLSATPPEKVSERDDLIADPVEREIEAPQLPMEAPHSSQDSVDNEEDQLEIPAFLRRQAN